MKQPSFREETRVAIDTVAQALELSRSGVGGNEHTLKGPRDLVTSTDVAVEDAVRATLTDALGHSVVGEERGGEACPMVRTGSSIRSAALATSLRASRSFS